MAVSSFVSHTQLMSEQLAFNEVDFIAYRLLLTLYGFLFNPHSHPRNMSSAEALQFGSYDIAFERSSAASSERP
jgi:hypothetical protein